MRKILFTILLLLVLSSMSVACSTTTTQTQTVTVTVTPTNSPLGSVLKKDLNWLTDTLTKDGVTYTRLEVSADIQNVSDDGTFYVNAEITPTDGGIIYLAKNSQTTQVYLRKGEEKTLIFDFWYKGDSAQYSVWCTHALF